MHSLGVAWPTFPTESTAWTNYPLLDWSTNTKVDLSFWVTYPNTQLGRLQPIWFHLSIYFLRSTPTHVTFLFLITNLPLNQDLTGCQFPPSSPRHPTSPRRPPWPKATCLSALHPSSPAWALQHLELSPGAKNRNQWLESQVSWSRGCWINFVYFLGINCFFVDFRLWRIVGLICWWYLGFEWLRSCFFISKFRSIGLLAYTAMHQTVWPQREEVSCSSLETCSSFLSKRDLVSLRTFE